MDIRWHQGIRFSGHLTFGEPGRTHLGAQSNGPLVCRSRCSSSRPCSPNGRASSLCKSTRQDCDRFRILSRVVQRPTAHVDLYRVFEHGSRSRSRISVHLGRSATPAASSPPPERSAAADQAAPAYLNMAAAAAAASPSILDAASRPPHRLPNAAQQQGTSPINRIPWCHRTFTRATCCSAGVTKRAPGTRAGSGASGTRAGRLAGGHANVRCCCSAG